MVDNLSIRLSEDKDQSYGYMVDLHEQKLGEWVDDTRQWIQGMPIGNYTHPQHGAINITPDRVKRYADQVKSGIRGQDLNIDYDHQTGVAAGWVKDAEARKDGLYLLIEWTATAAKHIRDKAYRYFSPEIHSHWEHPTEKKVYNDVLFGGGLTNRPFLKGIQPLTLNEESGESMNRELLELLAKQYGIEFDSSATDEDLNGKVTAAAKAAADNSGSDDDNDSSEDDRSEENDDAESSEDDKVLATLAEGNPVIAQMLAENQENARRLQILEGVAKANHVKVQLSELGTDKAQLSPKATEALQALMLKAPTDLGADIYKFAESILAGSAIIQLGEMGGKNDPIDSLELAEGQTPLDKFEAEVTKLMESDKNLDYSSASIQVAMNEPDLYAAIDVEVG